jgi:hypothetical protein
VPLEQIEDDDRRWGDSVASSIPSVQGYEVDVAVEWIVGHIAKQAGVSIDARRLGPALVDARARTGWGEEGIAVYCVEKLQRGSRRIRDPSAFLATGLRRLIAPSSHRRAWPWSRNSGG